MTKRISFSAVFLSAGLLISTENTLLHSQSIDLGALQGSDGFVAEGVQTFDYSGFSVSGAGDFNGDGKADLIIGAYRADGLNNTRDRAGDSYIVFGGNFGFPPTVDLATLANSNGSGVTLYGADNTDYSGFSVSGAGDVNGDGFGDILIGAPYADGTSNGTSKGGETYVVFGTSNITTDYKELSLLETNDGTFSGFRILGLDVNDYAGACVSGAGDFNGDGFSDIIIGARHADGPSNARDRAGESYLIFGRPPGAGGTNPFGNSISVGSLSTVVNGLPYGFSIQGIDALDRSGKSVSGVGDFNGDGFDDILIGAYNANGPANGRTFAGESFLIFGKASGFPTALDLTTIPSGDGSQGFVIYGVDARDYSGFSVSGAGDFNGDGLSDLLIGAYRADGPGNTRGIASDTTVVFGKQTGITPVLELSTIESGNGSEGFVLYGVQAQDSAGNSVSSAGDYNGDGFSDLLIGAYKADGLNNAKGEAGDSYLIFGAPQVTAGTLDLTEIQNGNGSKGFTIYGKDTFDLSGYSVSSAGDLDNDGFSDIIIGAYFADGPTNTRNLSGDSYVLLGEGTATQATYKGYARSGNAPRQAFGISGDGSNHSTPSGRVWIDFADGTNTSLQTATLYRSAPSNLLKAAPVYWQLSTNRTGWTSATVTLRWTLEESVGLDFERILVYTAPTPSGPWRSLPSTVNQSTPGPSGSITATTNTLGYFAIALDQRDSWLFY